MVLLGRLGETDILSALINASTAFLDKHVVGWE